MPRRGGVRRRGGLGQRKDRRGHPDRRGGGLGAQGQLTKRQKERIAERSLHRRTPSQRQPGLAASQAAKEQRLAAEAEASRREFNRLAAERREKEAREQKRLADEEQRRIDTAKRLEEQRLDDMYNPEIVEEEFDMETLEEIDQLLKEQASNFRAPVFETAPSEDILRRTNVRPPVFETAPNVDIAQNYETIEKIVKDNPNVFGDANARDFYLKDNILQTTGAYPQRVGSVGQVGNLPGILGMGAGMLFGKDTPMFTADPAFTREADRRRAGPDRRALEEGIPAVAKDVSPLSTPLADTIPTADIVNPETGAIDYSNTMASSPVLTTPAASPAAMTPITTQGTPYRLRDYYAGILGQDPSIYQTAANGGRIGKMHGGMMIMGDDGVVNNGIGGILSKYKEIRSEL